MKINPFVVYETPEGGGGSPPAAPVAAPPAAAPPQASPWSADAAAYFGDDAAAVANFDRYMREKQQPYITELENHPGRKLHADLSGDARDQTMYEIVAELYGDDVANEWNALGGDPAAVPEAAAVAAGTPDAIPDWAKPLVDREQRQADADARAAAEQNYNEQLDEMKGAHSDLTDADIELIHPFISAAGGDMEQAYQAYQRYTEQFKAHLGVTPVQAAAEEAAPPPVLGTSGAAATAPPVESKFTRWDQLDEATSDWLAEGRPQTPPPVL